MPAALAGRALALAPRGLRALAALAALAGLAQRGPDAAAALLGLAPPRGRWRSPAAQALAFLGLGLLALPFCGAWAGLLAALAVPGLVALRLRAGQQRPARSAALWQRRAG
ncbi:hypothetical protein [Pseudoroseomonas cervicalis]|uniref:hypothetical protein n=1 Tax=Teichococcus cervicalis TaxID=204525 RepID=UPI0022F1723C|nr:hypothetical protein [Pseudoroseomonas cervicalis]WBV41463.1 hypothetical protein PFY06_09365 [Pseudoroseomonas cervicalis]